MNTTVIFAAIGGLITLIVGFFVGKKTKRPTKVPSADGLSEAKEVLNEHAEKVEKAGEDLADAMADNPSGRVDRVLEWYKKRKGAGRTG